LVIASVSCGSVPNVFPMNSDVFMSCLESSHVWYTIQKLSQPMTVNATASWMTSNTRVPLIAVYRVEFIDGASDDRSNFRSHAKKNDTIRGIRCKSPTQAGTLTYTYRATMITVVLLVLTAHLATVSAVTIADEDVYSHTCTQKHAKYYPQHCTPLSDDKVHVCPRCEPSKNVHRTTYIGRVKGFVMNNLPLAKLAKQFSDALNSLSTILAYLPVAVLAAMKAILPASWARTALVAFYMIRIIYYAHLVTVPQYLTLFFGLWIMLGEISLRDGYDLATRLGMYRVFGRGGGPTKKSSGGGLVMIQEEEEPQPQTALALPAIEPQQCGCHAWNKTQGKVCDRKVSSMRDGRPVCSIHGKKNSRPTFVE